VFVLTLDSIDGWRCYLHLIPAALEVPAEPVYIGLCPSYRFRVVPAG
jgi:hypothetical protein